MLSACGGDEHPATISNHPASHNTRDIAFDTQIAFDEDAHMLPRVPMTATQAIMLEQIGRAGHEFAKTRIAGKAGSLIKKTAVAAILQGLGTFAGAAFANITGLNALSYGKLAMGSGAGGGAFSGYMTIEQAQSYASAAWQIAQIDGLRRNGDPRLKNIIAVPIIGMNGTPMEVDWSKVSLTNRQECLAKASLPGDIANCDNEKLLPSADDAAKQSMPPM